MPKAKRTPAKSPRKKAAEPAPAPAIDLDDPMVNSALTVACVAVMGIALGGAIPTSIEGVVGVLGLDALDAGPLHAKWWPFSALLTLHVLNNTKSNNKWWLNDVTACAFNCFGGLMIGDALQGNFMFPTLFADGEAKLSLVAVCWYFGNHNLPMTSINVYEVVTGFLGQFLPLDSLMQLSSLVYNAQILLAVANAGGSTSTWALVPVALGKLIYSCIFVHCASQFYNQRGLSFNVGSASSKDAADATLVAFWYGTNGLAALPLLGEHLAKVTGMAEGVFGGRDQMVMTLFVLRALVGFLVPFMNMNKVYDALYQFSGVRRRG